MVNRWGEEVPTKKFGMTRISEEFEAVFNHCGAKYQFFGEYNGTMHLTARHGDCSPYSDSVALVIEALLNIDTSESDHSKVPVDPLGQILEFVNALQPKPAAVYDYWQPFKKEGLANG